MMTLWHLAQTLKIWNDTRGQDIVEYALGAGFVVLAITAFAPGLSASIATVFANVILALQAVGGGSGAPAN